MGGSFSIKSVRSDAELIFEDYDGDYFNVRLKSTEVSAALRVWSYENCQSLVDLLSKLSEQTQGWTSPAHWNSIEYDLSLEFRCDSLGHVTVRVTMQHVRGAEDWKIEAEIETELGQMPQIAAHTFAFFQADLFRLKHL